MVLNFDTALLKRKINKKFLLASLKRIIIIKVVPKAEFKKSGLPHWSLFCSAPHTCHSLLSEQYSWSQKAFGTILKFLGSFLKAGTSFLKSVSGRIFWISKCFYRGKRNFSFNFFHIKTANNSNHQRSCTDLVLNTFKQILLLWHSPVFLYIKLRIHIHSTGCYFLLAFANKHFYISFYLWQFALPIHFYFLFWWKLRMQGASRWL